MFTDDQNQDVLPEEETEQVEEETEGETDSKDPYDSMSEVELRAEAKKLRAIGNRKKPKESEEKVPPALTDVVRRSDFERANEAKARRLLEAKGDEVSKEILAHWDDLAPIYGKVASRGKNSEEDIVEDLYDSHAVWLRRRPAPKADTKEAEAEVATISGTGGTSPEGTTPPKKRIIQSQRSMSDWYA
jgi:hypothetical protein